MPLTLVLVACVSAFISTVAYLFWRRMNYWRQRGIPHDEPSYLYGSFHRLTKAFGYSEILRSMYERFKYSGPFCGYYFFQRPAVMVLDMELVKNILIKDFANFSDRGLFHNKRDDPLTGHLFFVDGSKWRILHGKLSPIFSEYKVRGMFPYVRNVALQMVDVLNELVKRGSSIEVKELMGRYTTDVIGKCALGIECNSLKNPNAECRTIGRRISTDRRHGLLVSALIEGFPKLARLLRMAVTHPDIEKFFMRLVRENVEYRQKNNVRGNDLMNLLMELSKSKNLRYDENDEFKGLTVEEMTAQAFFFFAAGSEKSSATLSYTLYELALQPELQERLRCEVNETLEQHDNELTYECLNEMQYMKQVLAETLRKYPVLPHLARQALHDYVVPGHPKYVIPAGMLVTIPVVGIHYDAEIYPNPELFDPERFTPERMKLREKIEWLPFGDGPRKCIGFRFGHMEMSVALVYLMQHFRFSVSAMTKSGKRLPKNGIFLKVERV
ncbi:PREDICTED: cytochrome P450 6a2-like [Rhagoletis zephyria]|uniref:cytochrome P450 6a2-like n=1 Tax=Rhagoletis zephyria TaxID=28612 RepID=UPI0008115080|nr:PREDICTED: cytochrome P450 6a2-like [Rhagoletis zephyria]